MDIEPTFSVTVDTENEGFVVTVNEIGTTVSRESFSRRERADDYARGEYERLSRKYAAMGKPRAEA